MNSVTGQINRVTTNEFLDTPNLSLGYRRVGSLTIPLPINRFIERVFPTSHNTFLIYLVLEFTLSQHLRLSTPFLYVTCNAFNLDSRRGFTQWDGKGWLYNWRDYLGGAKGRQHFSYSPKHQIPPTGIHGLPLPEKIRTCLNLTGLLLHFYISFSLSYFTKSFHATKIYQNSIKANCPILTFRKGCSLLLNSYTNTQVLLDGGCGCTRIVRQGAVIVFYAAAVQAS